MPDSHLPLETSAALSAPEGEQGATQHPVDALLRILRGAGGGMRAPEARARMDEQGLGQHYAQAVCFWKNAGFLSDDGLDLRLLHSHCITEDNPVTPAHWQPTAPPVAADAGPSEGCSPLALLSLFDGTGLARVAIDTAVRALGDAGPPLVSSAFAEIQTDLGTAVQSLRAQRSWKPRTWFYRIRAEP